MSINSLEVLAKNESIDYKNFYCKKYFSEDVNVRFHCNLFFKKALVRFMT